MTAMLRSRTESGLTLIELMVAITISTMIVGVLASASIIFMRHSFDSDRAYDDQNSVQLLTSVFVADAQSATSVVTNDNAPCGAAGPALVTFSWADAGTTIAASWFVENTAGRLALVRRRCTNGTPTEKTDVAGVKVAPAVTCSPDCTTASSITITGTTTNGSTFGITGARRASAS